MKVFGAHTKRYEALDRAIRRTWSGRIDYIHRAKSTSDENRPHTDLQTLQCRVDGWPRAGRFFRIAGRFQRARWARSGLQRHAR